MGIRTEKVVLTLDDRFSSKGARVAAQAALMASAMDRLADNADTAGTSTRRLGNDVNASTKAFRKGAADIDVFSGRLKLMAQTTALIGPGLIPLAGAAVPAITGLASGLGAAAGAAGVFMLAFNGVGDSLEALNNYQLDPTRENLVALEQELDRLGPAGAQFVTFIDSIGSDLEQLQRVAGEGLFPGMEQGITDLMTLLPQVSDIVSRIATEMGDLSAMAGEALSTDADWGEFFSFLQTDAAPTLDAFARSAGNVAASFANLMVAFAPLSRDFTANMLEGSQALREWTANGENLEGFIDYIQSVGPQAAEFLGALVEAIVAMTAALAPWGSTVLPILTTVLELFTAIASSPIGGPLTTAAIAMLAFNKAASGFGTVMGKVGPAVSGAQSSLRQMPADLKTVAGGWVLASSATERESKKMAAATDRLKSSMATIGKGAGVIGAVGIAASGAADGIGLTNTAMLGLTGTVAGPWGAAAGAGVGLLLDFKAAQDRAAESAAALADTFDRQTGAMTANTRAAVVNTLEKDGTLKDAQSVGASLDLVTDAILGNAEARHLLAEAYIENYNAANIYGEPAAIDKVDAWGRLNDAINQNSTSIDSAAASARRQSDALGGAADAAAGYGRTTLEANAATEAQRNAARSTAKQFIGLGKSLDDAKVSLGGWLAEMEKSARDLERFGQNAARAARRGLDQGLIASLNEAGPAGARRMAQLANATDAELARANAAWRRGQAAITNYVNLRVPPKKITVDISSAVSNVRAVQAVIDSLRGKSVTVTTFQKTVYGAAKMASIAAAQGKADGGMIHGPGTGTSDDVPIWASNGEFVIRAAAVDRYGQGFFERLNAMAYADGGLVRRDAPGFAAGGRVQGFGTRVHSPAGWANIARALDRHEKALGRSAARIEKSMRSHEKAIDRSKQTLETWNQRRDQLRSSVSNSLQRDWMGGNSGNVWASTSMSGTAAFAQEQWRKQAADARRLSKVIANMRKYGAGDAFIAEILQSSDPLAAAEMFNKQGHVGMLQSQRLFLDASRATSSAANSTSAIYADEQRRATSELQGLRKDLATLGKRLDRNHAQAEATRKRESAAAAAGKGARDRR